MSQIPKTEVGGNASLGVNSGGRVDQRMSEKYALGTSPQPGGMRRGGGEVLKNRAVESRSPYVSFGEIPFVENRQEQC